MVKFHSWASSHYCMKKLILAAVVTIGAVTASQAGGHFNVGFGLPFGPPPPPGLRAPAVVVSAPVCAPAPVRYVAPVCETPAVVYDTPVCAPAPVYGPPPVRIAPRPP